MRHATRYGMVYARVLTGLLVTGGWAVTRAAEPAVAAWAEFTGGGVSLRAIVTGSDCPTAVVDGKPLAMTLREASTPEFPVTSCQAAPWAKAKIAVIDGRTVSVAPRKLRRIVVIGDTGCRLKGAVIQECNDPKKWPFSTMTKNAAAKHPDLVIHVGDYYYRETPCPAGHAECQGSPNGDRWESWRADFFDPASTLLAAAPWVFARGNHEQCGRGSNGWFRFLDAGASPLACPAAAAPFAIRLDRLKLDVIDSADIEDRQLSGDRLALYRKQISAIGEASEGRRPGATWVITHKPLWGYELTRAGEKLLSRNPLLAAAANALDRPGKPQLADVDLLLAGHIHLFAALDFSTGRTSLRPAQLIVGGSGTALDSSDVTNGEQIVDGVLAKYTVDVDFGYLVLDRRKKNWIGTLYSVDDAVLAKCRQEGRGIDCTPPAK